METRRLLLFLQVLTYAQQSRERSNYEQASLNERMQEYRRQIDRESRWSSNGSNGSPNGDGIQAIGRSSHKMIEAVMQSAAKGKVCRTFTPMRELLQIILFRVNFTSKTRSKLSGSNNQTRLSVKTIL
jgi:hypothetical protein